MSNVHLFGIRHHGPGSARSLKAALERLEPDVILIEGPPEAEPLLNFLESEDLKPPVAMLSYVPEDPSRCAFFPFADFSPEWIAMKHGVQHGARVRFMDMPQVHWLAPREAAAEEQIEASPFQKDPISHLAEAAGYSDSERWWEHHVELRGNEEGIFEAVLGAMGALREVLVAPHDAPRPASPFEEQREAFMRESIRKAQKDGFEKIAVVCGAWHAPALLDPGNAKADKALLKDLPKAKIAMTWVPWTHGRLAFSSGYGAGVESPGWYSHLWRNPENPTVSWMVRVAQLLRSKDLDASSASVIEAVRLAETLTALTQRKVPGLPELMDAVRAVLCFGDDGMVQVIHQELILGEELGTVPAEVPSAPLSRDLQALQKRLRLSPAAGAKDLDLDLRKENDLERSQVLHRLRLLGVNWGEIRPVSTKGTFKEGWTLQWMPEYEIRLIEAGRYGQTVASASENRVLEITQQATTLPEVTQVLQDTLLAHLPEATKRTIQKLSDLAASSTDVTHLMQAIPSLGQVARYGNVRQTDTQLLLHVLDGLIARVCVGLSNAVASLDDQAADQMQERVQSTHAALRNLQNEEYLKEWQGTLKKISSQGGVHGLVVGRVVRLLSDAREFNPDEVAKAFRLGLSNPEPEQAANWAEGFLKGSGLVLIHDHNLWNLLDHWVTELSEDAFQRILPLMRRTFSTFAPAERKKLGEQARQGQGTLTAQQEEGINVQRSEKVLPLLHMILGSA
ncbi:DUF5682 family protein [Deinococcus roseus]|uniref:Uncharacterized protein n=1 Tax=Deinococcus roseus TaxID=392414 RepID=A0ABQ2DEM2_9DEIO|nr:DUF5682 family protein [Deinococcus roseus]GGJ54991.1 hypothetical protein GCM10008938_46310 [Deinococcus roseus]